MKKDYINKIKANITVSTNKKTSNLLDGLYNSIYKGKSLDFDDLREYIVGDDIKDIDWKSSTRNGSLLVRRFVAQKKHNFLLILDSGTKMDGETSTKESKKDVALMTMGTISYLISKNGDEIAATYYKDNKIQLTEFKTGLNNVESLLYNYEACINKNNNDINYLINNINIVIKRKCIIFIITDMDGLNNLKVELLKKLSFNHDIFVINISDLSIENLDLYDLENNYYLPNYIIKNKEIYEIDNEIKKEIIANANNKFKNLNIQMTTINSNKEIVFKLIDILERKNHENIH